MTTTRLPELPARSTLTGGVACLAVGIALVGAGADHEGAVFVLGGMALTIFGIHSFGRLGPEEPPAAKTVYRSADDDEDAPPDRQADAVLSGRAQSVGRGVVVAAAGAAVLAGGAPSTLGQVLASLAILAGGLLLWQGVRADSAPPTTPARRRRTERRRRSEEPGDGS